ncbi:hypothetical protein FIV42_12555 [Persicimonas caeni]|uniref:DUF4168 domain-containing protein n=1 Tax=Persicimonas caeni TaxID=2292766 RepID=A0A4Y6PUW4_PERCE|nr:hypothetical protein [Persicimonas caeni]QDG51545.1 hypothetical protein FIV42_12555 [Persicimonas caeni]QED32766.1 hypothetical protein FRD00_12550 [Persicimonas caeni]
MQNQTAKTWTHRLAGLLAALGLAFGAAACDSPEEEYEETHMETTEADEQVGMPVGEEPTEEEEFGLGEDQEEQQMGQMDQQQMGQMEGEQPIPQLEASDITDEQLATYAELKLRIEQQREEQRGQIGGGPPDELPELSPEETSMIQNAGMETDRFLAIQMMLGEDQQLQQRYQQVLQKIHDQPADMEQQDMQQQEEQGQPATPDQGESY